MNEDNGFFLPSASRSIRHWAGSGAVSRSGAFVLGLVVRDHHGGPQRVAVLCRFDGMALGATTAIPAPEDGSIASAFPKHDCSLARLELEWSRSTWYQKFGGFTGFDRLSEIHTPQRFAEYILDDFCMSNWYRSMLSMSRGLSENLRNGSTTIDRLVSNATTCDLLGKASALALTQIADVVCVEPVVLTSQVERAVKPADGEELSIFRSIARGAPPLEDFSVDRVRAIESDMDRLLAFYAAADTARVIDRRCALVMYRTGAEIALQGLSISLTKPMFSARLDELAPSPPTSGDPRPSRFVAQSWRTRILESLHLVRDSANELHAAEDPSDEVVEVCRRAYVRLLETLAERPRTDWQ
jgi:hypothetical protein